VSMTTLFETTDAEAAHAMLVATYGAMRLSVTSERHGVRVRAARHTVGPIELHHNTFSMRFHVDADPIRRVTMGRVLRGSFSYRRGAERCDNEPGDIFLLAQADSPYQSINIDVDLEFAVIDPALFVHVADTTREPFRFTGAHPVSAQATRLWSTTYDFVRDNVADTPAAREPLLAGNAARLLVATALATFPNNLIHEPTIEDRRDAHPATLRRAVAFIDANAHRDVSPADVAGAAHVTIRTLQLAFRRHLDTTPGAYLRRVRLEHAHRDLLSGDPATTTVGAVAARWGFASHSRFTAHYHAVYGQPPSDTLRTL